MKLEINKGDRFGNWEVIKELDKGHQPSGQTYRLFVCECVCGRSKEIRIAHLVRKNINSCGCLDKRYRAFSDNERYIRKIWRAIKYRTGANYQFKHNYYDKGIRVCDKWAKSFTAFNEWAKKNNLRKGFDIDRINNNGNYSPENCRVVTPIINANNKDNTFFIEYDGKQRPFMLAVREKGLFNHHRAIRRRIERGWTAQRAIDTPIRKGNYRH